MGWCAFHAKDRTQRYLVDGGICGFRGQWICRPGDFCKGWGEGAKEAARTRHHPLARPESTATSSWQGPPPSTPAAVPVWSLPPSYFQPQPGTGQAPDGLAAPATACQQPGSSQDHTAQVIQPPAFAKAPPMDLIPAPIFGQTSHVFVYASTSPCYMTPVPQQPSQAPAAASANLPSRPDRHVAASEVSASEVLANELADDQEDEKDWDYEYLDLHRSDRNDSQPSMGSFNSQSEDQAY
jgi:hypothetical protein